MLLNAKPKSSSSGEDIEFNFYLRQNQEVIWGPQDF